MLGSPAGALNRPFGRTVLVCQHRCPFLRAYRQDTSGYRAAHSYIALRLLGYPRVRTYVGSWKEWGDKQHLPIEIPNPS